MVVSNGVSMFDWNYLKYFLAVARCGSTVAAAKVLKVDRSTVHRRLDAFKKDLGRQLILRQPTGYDLTELGRSMLVYAEHLEETAQIFERRVSGFDSELSPGVNIAIIIND